MKTIVGDLSNKAFDATMGKIQPEYIGVNALASSLALLVMADREVDNKELEEVSEFLLDMDIIIERDLSREVGGFFLSTVESLQKGYKEGPVQGNMIVGEILTDISKVKEDEEWLEILESTVTLVTSSQGLDKREQKIRDRIMAVLK